MKAARSGLKRCKVAPRGKNVDDPTMVCEWKALEAQLMLLPVPQLWLESETIPVVEDKPGKAP